MARIPKFWFQLSIYNSERYRSRIADALGSVTRGGIGAPLTPQESAPIPHNPSTVHRPLTTNTSMSCSPLTSIALGTLVPLLGLAALGTAPSTSPRVI